MRHNYILTASLLGGVLLLAGCVKEKSNDDIYRPFGSEIVFGAATEYENGDGTRTVYSGDVTSGAPAYERIDWIDGDDMKIFYKVGSAAATNGTYAVAGSTVTANGKDSYAEVFHDSGTKLTWGSGGDHVFTAAYPASANFNGTTLSGNIPASQPVTLNSNQADNVARYLPQSMSYAYMLSKKTVSNGSTTSRVDLPFTPAMTAFQFKFKVKTGDNAVTVKKFEMTVPNESGINPLTGDFTVTISGENNSGATWNKNTTGDNPTTIGSNTGRKITVDFGSGVQMTTSNYLDFTVMALPVNISHVTITFTFGDSTTKSMKLQKNGNWVTFDACKKWVITNVDVPGGETWMYYVQDIADIATYGHVATPNLGFTVKSYRVKSGGTVIEPVKWKVQYSTSANGPWSDTQPSAWQTNGAKFSITSTTGNGCSGPSAAGEANAANIARSHTASEKEISGFDSEHAAIAVLQGREALPSTTSDAGDGYFDLSKHPIYPVSAIDGAEITQETANCYVVTRPGKYKFPLVYGNAIRYGAANTKAFAPGGLTSTNNNNYYMNRFLNHNDQAITDPWLKNNGATPTDAVVVWQDVKNASMQILLDSDISISGDYIKFEIKSERIRPGNIILAARQNGTIVWSWHIWVTEKELGPHTVIDKMGVTNEMMEYNLGWTDKTDGYGEHWNDWPFYIRIIQTDAGGSILNNNNPQNVDAIGAAEVFSVTQFGESITVDPNVGSNPFYQWGRKDPILPAASTNASKNYYSAQGYTVTDPSDPRRILNEAISGNSLSVSVAIQTPNHLVHHTGSHHWIGGGTANGLIGNLWDADMITTRSGGLNAQTMVNRLPIKTIYDPSPRGYVVPWAYVFSNFWDKAATYNSGYGNPVPNNGLVTSEGYKFNDGNGGTIFIPFAGARGGDGNNPSQYIYDVTKSMYYWSAGSLPCDDPGSDAYLKAKHFCYWNEAGMGIRAFYDQYKEGAYPIRPVLESVQRVNTGVTTGGMDGNTYDFNDGWTIN